MPRWPWQRRESAPQSGIRFTALPFAAVNYSKAWVGRKNEARTASESPKTWTLAERLALLGLKADSLSPEPQDAEQVPSAELASLVGSTHSGVHLRHARPWHSAPGRIRPPAYTDLVHKEISENEDVAGVEVPQWIVEIWQDSIEFGRAVRRLGLPERSVKSKLPYYRCERRTSPLPKRGFADSRALAGRR